MSEPNINPPEYGPAFADLRTADRLGGGTFADVYQGQYLRADGAGETRCAVKIIRDPSTSRSMARFANEVYALSRLSHPSIPSLIAYGPTPQPFIAMTLAEGTSLRRVMHERQRKPLDPRAVVTLLDKLLEALLHIHERGVVHRDVKDDNVIVSNTLQQLWLVDFGFCRADGQPADPATWGPVGSDRYAPPTKLESPSTVDGTHDVFAAGVLAFYLLSGQYPWEVDGDRGDLLRAMRTASPPPLTRLNPEVPRDLTAFVMALLTVHDARRPTAAVALARLREVADRAIPPEVRRAVYRTTRAACPRVWRDPIHGDVRFTEFEWSVLNTPEFQRLGYLRQLGTGHYVYRGATHTRMQHSVGCLHVIERIMTAAEEVHGDTVDESLRLQARLYALIHDITHIPFGHALEDELGLFERHDHNHVRAARILGPSSKLNKVLLSTPYGKSVLAYFDPAPTEHRNKLVEEMLSGSVGADVLDYVDRDAVFCGLDERIDSSIFRRFRIIPEGLDDEHVTVHLSGKYGLRVDALTAMQKVFAARYGLYEKVYCHPVKVAADAMIGKALYQALQPGRAAAPAEMNEGAIERFGDDELLLHLRRSGRRDVRSLADRVWTRDLYGVVFMANVLEQDDHDIDEGAKVLRAPYDILSPAGRGKLERELSREVGGGIDHNDIIVFAQPKPPGYSRLKYYSAYFDQGQALHPATAAVRRLFNEIRRRHVDLWRVYVFCSDRSFRVAQRIADLMKDKTGLTNRLPDIGPGPRLF